MVKQQRFEHIRPLRRQLVSLQKGKGQEEADVAHLRGVVQHVPNHIGHIIFLHRHQQRRSFVEVVEIVSDYVRVVGRDQVEQRLIDGMQVFAAQEIEEVLHLC